jgi:hypothetical protein
MPSKISLTSCKISREELNISRIFIGHFKRANTSKTDKKQQTKQQTNKKLQQQKGI